MVGSRLQQRYRKRATLSLLLAILLLLSLVAGSIFYLPEIILGITSVNSKLFKQTQSIDAGANADTIAPAIPILEPLPETTSDQLLTVIGTTEKGAKVHLYRNGSQISTTSADTEGKFSFDNIKLEDKNEFYIVAEDFAGNTSESSTHTVLLLTKGPLLTVEGKVDNKEGKANISGETDSDATVTINGRRAIVNRSGSFGLELKLSAGENKLLVIATDKAENTTEQEITLNYSPED